MNGLLKYLTGKATAPLNMLVALGFAVFAFVGLPLEATETTPTNGLPDSAESVQVAKIQENFDVVEGSAAFIVYFSDTEFTQTQLEWIQGAFDPQKMMPSGGANEKFLEFSNAEVMGEKFVPPAAISEDGTTALITVPLDATDDFELTTERVETMRELAPEAMPVGIDVYVTGPEAFIKDVGSIFEGADFLLLAFTAGVVAVLLLVTYRSPVLWLIPLAVVGTADGMAGILARRVADFLGFVPDGSVTGILSVLVFGAATNYALLLIARYREELLNFEDRREAMRVAIRGAGPAILASGSTVAVALALLLLAEIEGRQVLGLVSAVGIVVAMVAGLLVLPSALVVFGRWIFWPFVPRVGGKNPYEKSIWSKLGNAVSKKPLAVAAIGVAILGGLASGGLGIKNGLSATEIFIEKPEAVLGQEVLADAFPAGSATPTFVVVETEYVDEARELVDIPGVAEISDGQSDANYSELRLVLDADPESNEALEVIRDLRVILDELPDGAIALVGGQDASTLDVTDATARDQALLVPLILVSVFLILILLLRSLAAPIFLMIAVVGSFFSALGASWLIFQYVYGFPALDLTVLILAFLFLVALGVDYSIFLVTRAQEEARLLGTRAGMRKALGATGGVITSAGVLLAAVFTVLGVLPLIALAQVGTIVGIGVLLDTLLVRTIIVPAIAFVTGKKFWWPRKEFAD
ncbi:MAG: MMPL family transporter [Aquiluna sp.]|nr:MMPL family transporter [Actinomycetota bacterium]NCW29006.1 MMPL family transporter [Actinomycetota bacterium]NCW95323.1 MMPL family transporter [Actinomycetota bacterium]